MAKRKKVQAPDEKQNIMKKIVKEELERRGRTKGEDTRSVSALSGISHTNTETLAKTDDIWGAAAGAKRNIEAEARRYRQQEKVRQENIQKTQAQMQQEHSKQWKDLDIKQQQELG